MIDIPTLLHTRLRDESAIARNADALRNILHVKRRTKAVLGKGRFAIAGTTIWHAITGST
jgi:hypothetical protein